MGLIEKAGRFVPVLGAAIELKNSLSPETIKRRMKILGVGALTLSAVGAGVYASDLNKPDEQHTITMDGGVGTVKDINRNLAELHMIGFTTQVDGVWVEERETDRKLGIVGLPDITHELLEDGRVWESSLCIAGGDKSKDITTETINGVKHTTYEIDPADISVCTRESVDSLVLQRQDGNWITNMNDAGDDLNKLGRDAEDQKNNKALEKQNKLRAKMARIARNASLRTVNRECGPMVFDLMKEQALDRAEDLLGREGEVFTAKYPNGLKEAVIEGRSEVDKFFEELPNSQEPNKKFTYEVKGMGECKISPEAMSEAAPVDTAGNPASAVVGDN